jgi:hypothetical protein
MRDNQVAVKNLIVAFTGQANYLVIPRIFLDLLNNDHVGALLLNQMIYWSDRGDDQGWFYKTYADWHDELGFSPYQVARATKQFKALGIVETKIKKANGNPTLYYRVDMQVVTNLLETTLKKVDQRLSKNLINADQKTSGSLTETTPETTTYILQEEDFSLQDLKTDVPQEQTIPEDVRADNAVKVHGNNFDPEHPVFQEDAKYTQASPSPRRNADEYRSELLGALQVSAGIHAGEPDVSHYPEDVRDIICEFCVLWHIQPPTPREKSSKAAWISSARELAELCGADEGYGLDHYYLDEWSHKPSPPFSVYSPRSIINGMRRYVSQAAR